MKHTEQMNNWIDVGGRMDGCIDGWMKGRMDR